MLVHDEPESDGTGGRPAARGGLTGNLGAFSVTFMVIAAAAPLTVVGGVIPVGFLLGNGAGFPTMFLVATVILLLFSVGLMEMSKRLPDAGAFFTYISHGLGRIPGVAAAYTALICYTTIQAAVFAYFGATSSANIALLGGPTIPWWVLTLLCIVAVGALGYRHIELSSRVLLVALLAEMAVVLVLAGAIVVSGGAEGLSLTPFTLDAALSGSPALGLMFAVASFIGFESTVVYRSEVRNPDRTIPRATYGSALLVGVFFAFASWAMVMGLGPSDLLDRIGGDPATVITRLTDRYLGEVGSVAVTVLLLGSMFAAVLSLHNVLTRYFRAMGAAGLLPAGIAEVHPRHNSPHRASVLQVCTAAAIAVIGAVAGIAPESIFAWFAGVGTLAIVVLMGGTCLAVVVFFARRPRRPGPWRAFVAPSLGFLGLAISSYLIASNFPLLVGDLDASGAPAWGAVSIGLAVLTVVAPLVGVVQALVVRRRDPAAFAAINRQLDAQ